MKRKLILSSVLCPGSTVGKGRQVFCGRPCLRSVTELDASVASQIKTPPQPRTSQDQGPLRRRSSWNPSPENFFSYSYCTTSLLLYPTRSSQFVDVFRSR